MGFMGYYGEPIPAKRQSDNGMLTWLSQVNTVIVNAGIGWDDPTHFSLTLTFKKRMMEKVTKKYKSNYFFLSSLWIPFGIVSYDKRKLLKNARMQTYA